MMHLKPSCNFLYASFLGFEILTKFVTESTGWMAVTWYLGRCYLGWMWCIRLKLKVGRAERQKAKLWSQTVVNSPCNQLLYVFAVPFPLFFLLILPWSGYHLPKLIKWHSLLLTQNLLWASTRKANFYSFNIDLVFFIVRFSYWVLNWRNPFVGSVPVYFTHTHTLSHESKRSQLSHTHTIIFDQIYSQSVEKL